MVFISWNVNGLRACLKKGFLEFLNAQKPDFMCLQETKMERGQADIDLSGYQDLTQASGWARDALSWAVGEGLVGSTTSGALTLSPQKSANRAEVATMLRAFGEKIL